MAVKQRVLFIGGLGRSGSTLIERLLNEYPQTFAIGESVHIWERGLRDNELCGCGEPFHHCDYWSAVGRTAFGDWSEVDTEQVIQQRWDIDRSRRLPQMIQAHRTRTIPAAYREYLDMIGSVLTAAGTVARERTGADVVLDSSKHLSSAVLYSLDDRLDVRVLHVIRDPRGVAYSWTKQISRPEATGGTMIDMPRYAPARTAGRWVTDNTGFAQLQRLGIPTMRLRYEDFLADSLGSLERVATFAGIDPPTLPDGVFDGSHGVLSTQMHSAAGNPMRFGSANVRLRLDDGWRTEMPASQRRLVSALTAGSRQRLGY
jgi:hypothetical protein